MAKLTAEVKSNFKNSEDSGFCVRNRYLARNTVDSKTSGLRFDIGYEVKQDSLVRVPGGIAFQLKSIHEETPFLNGEVVMLNSGILHVFFDEIEPIHTRYRAPHDDILNRAFMVNINDDEIKIENSRVIFQLDKFRYEISFSPFKIAGFLDDLLTLKVNDQGLFNFDRYRLRGIDLRPLNQTTDQSNPIKVLDSAGLYKEEDGELVQFDGLWTETFRTFTDNKKRGPSSVALDFSFQDASDVYGLPEHADRLSLKDTVNEEPYRLYNIDHPEHQVDIRQGLYGNIPFMLSRSSQKISGGVF